MDDNRPKKQKKDPQKRMILWIIKLFCMTVVISSVFSFLSSLLLSEANTVVAFILLLLIVTIGVLFDVIGVAVTAADPKPFHSMAAKKKKGAKEAVSLIRNADHVSSVCNDVVGDICGIISGSASAAIVATALAGVMEHTVATIAMSALVAGLTIGGKAVGKSLAIAKATSIVLFAARAVYCVKAFARALIPGRKQKNKR